MKKVIDGKMYNTDTATAICKLSCTCHRGDFGYHATTLYRSPKGQYFLAGTGGPMSMWAERACGGGYSGGSGIKVIDADEAQTIAGRRRLLLM